MTEILGGKQGTPGAPDTCRCGHLYSAAYGDVRCSGWNLSGGASGMLQQCGCTEHVDFPMPTWQSTWAAHNRGIRMSGYGPANAEREHAIRFALAGDPYADG